MLGYISLWGGHFLLCVTCKTCHTGLDSIGKCTGLGEREFGRCLPHSTRSGGVPALSVTGVRLVLLQYLHPVTTTQVIDIDLM